MAPGVTVDTTRTVGSPDEAIAWLVRECDIDWDSAYEETGGLSDEVYLPLHTALHNASMPFEMECNGVVYYARVNA